MAPTMGGNTLMCGKSFVEALLIPTSYLMISVNAYLDGSFICANLYYSSAKSFVKKTNTPVYTYISVLPLPCSLPKPRILQLI